MKYLGLSWVACVPLFAVQDAPPGEVVTVDVVVQQRPQGTPPSPYLVNFTPKEPLKLSGKTAASGKLREALEKSIKFVLEAQGKDGSWRYDPSQIRADVPKNERTFQRTAAQSLMHPVFTALCCTALRSHEELAPARIKAAIEKGLEFVLAEAPKVDQKDYAIWTWAFSVSFLVDEYNRTQNVGQKQKILDAVRALVDKILRSQRPGTSTPALLATKAAKDKAKDPKPSWTEKMRQSEGGSIGIDPALENEPVGGVLIQKLAPGGPAEKAGIKVGDRIFEYDGHEVKGMGHLLDLIDSTEPGTRVKIKVRRGTPKAPSKPPEDGGWSYYPWAESMSFTTATTVCALLDAKSIGVDVPPGELDRGVKMIEAAHYRLEGMSEDGYLYRLHANKGSGVDIRGAIGRVAICSLALFKSGKIEEKELAESLETFVRRRGELDRVKGYPGNHCIRSYTNAAYYFLYGHYNTAQAVHALKDAAQKKKIGSFLQEAILSSQWKEGTWTDHQAWGELYGTTMALMTLGELKFLTPDAYRTPLVKLQAK
jgi:heme-degrading monooxygenase HmoA